MDFHTATNQFYEYSRFIKGYSPATIKRYKYVLTSYHRFAHIKTLSEVTEENLRNLFFNGRTARQWSTNTYIVFYKSLSIFLKWCLKHGHITENLMLKLERPKIEKRLPLKLTKSDTLHLLEIVSNYPYSSSFLRYRNHAIFATYIYAGLRMNELLKLKYADVDLESNTLFIRQGKGGKDRVVPINPILATILKNYLEQRKKANKTCPEFFVSSNRNCGFTESGMKNLVLLIRKSSGITFSAHKLRHTFATLMLEGGCDIYSLSQMMGHSDIKTTTIYLYASVEHLKMQIIKHPLTG